MVGMAASRDAPVRRVVITGLGLVSPYGVGVEPFWEGATAGKSAVRLLTSFDTSEYPSKIGGEILDFDASKYFGKRDANRMDRFAQIAAVASKEALEDADIKLRDRGGELAGHWMPENVDPNRMGSFIGTGIVATDIREIFTHISTLLRMGYQHPVSATESGYIRIYLPTPICCED